MITVWTYQRYLVTDEGSSWRRRDEAEAETPEAADLAARTLLDDAVDAGESLADLAVYILDPENPFDGTPTHEAGAGKFTPAEEYLAGATR